MTVEKTAVPVSGLDDDRVRAVLAEVYAAAKRDAAVIAEAMELAAGMAAPPTAAQQSDLAVRAALPVAPEVGRLLYLLVRLTGARRVVEFGTSFGASLVYLGAALRDAGAGTAFGTELNTEKVARARANVERAGLADVVRVLPGDARETLAALDGPFDLVLLDGWKELYADVLDVVEPKLRPGALVVADNLSMLPQEYLDRVRAPGGGYTSLSLPLGDGVELSLRS